MTDRHGFCHARGREHHGFTCEFVPKLAGIATWAWSGDGCASQATARVTGAAAANPRGRGLGPFAGAI